MPTKLIRYRSTIAFQHGKRFQPKDLEQSLEAERAQIFEFQEKVDAARDQIAEGDISEADLDALHAGASAITPTPFQ